MIDAGTFSLIFGAILVVGFLYIVRKKPVRAKLSKPVRRKSRRRK